MYESEARPQRLIDLCSAVLVEHAVKNAEGVLSDTGALITNTKKYTGRSPKDKFTVVDEQTKDLVWFSDINKKMQPHHAEALFNKINSYLAQRRSYVVNCMV